ncbi:MAG: hypothetical protein AAF750_02155 [Planctomycetota bacterium]
MNRIKRTWATCMVMGAAALSLPAASTLADDPALGGVPATVFGEDVAMTAYIDVEGMTPADLQAASEKMGNLIPMPNGAEDAAEGEEAEDGIAKYTEFRNAFTGSGGKGALFLVEVPVGDAEPDVKPVVMVKVNPGADKQGILDAMSMMSDDPADMEGVDLQPAGPGWMLATGPELGTPAADGNPQNMATLSSAMGTYGTAPVRMGFRLTNAMQAELATQIQGMEAGAGGNPMAGMFAGLAKGFQKTQYIGAGFQVKGDPQMMIAMKFPNAEDASGFQTGYTNALNMMWGFVSMQAGPDADPADMQAIFNALQMQAQGDSLEMVIGPDALGAVSNMAPAMGVPVP